MSDDRVPVTMLSGFLGAGAASGLLSAHSILNCIGRHWSDGSIFMLRRIMHAGKTTVLRHLLQNKTNLRIGCIVNDVASINVDAKLLRNDRNRGRSQEPKSTADLTDTIELANGCACEHV